MSASFQIPSTSMPPLILSLSNFKNPSHKKFNYLKMSFYQYRALNFKNWILWKRQIFGSLCELLFPILIFLTYAAMRSAVSSEDFDESSYLSAATYLRPDPSISVSYPYPEGNSFAYCADYLSEGGEWTIGLAPQNSITEYLQSKFLSHPNLSGASTTFFSDNSAVEDYVTSGDYEDTPKLCLAVVFDTFDENNYVYRIRYNETHSVADDDEVQGDYIDVFDMETYENTDEYVKDPKPEFQRQFIRSGFSLIQNWVDNYIIQQITGDKSSYIAPAFVPMYYDEWVDDDFVVIIKKDFSFLVTTVYLVPFSRMIASIVYEKEYKIKEMMMMMGLSNFVYWMSWITYYFILYVILAIFATGILGNCMFEYSDAGYLFLIFFLLGISCMGFSLLLSVFFSRVKFALICGMMVYIASACLNYAVNDEDVKTSQKQLASFLPTTAFSMGMLVMFEFEIGEVGVNSNTFDKEVVNFRFSYAIYALIVDTFLFFVFAIYFEQVWPNEWGTKKPWYFLFTRAYWFQDSSSAEDFDKDVSYGRYVEPVDAVHEQQKKSGKCMMIRNLTKIFDGKKAVDELSLDIYQGEITALLGHNGAGKTTTISMLSGLISPTYGDMKVEEMVLSRDLDKIRKNLGVCPQHNVLFHELTPEEHLYIYSIFKGMTDGDAIREKVDEKLKELKLVEYKDRKSENLSGGQKRKLSLAIALIADSKIVILDEPTSGIDLSARRLMWEILEANSAGRIVIFTTHHMQEVEVLAKKIAIISHGKLKCLGSSLYLKSEFGGGYSLKLDKLTQSEEYPKEIEAFVKDIIPETKLIRNTRSEVVFEIPSSSSLLFQNLFNGLDTHLQALEISSYSFSITTLEEVFIRLARSEKHSSLSVQPEVPERPHEEIQNLLENKRQTEGLFGKHLKALLVKRFRISKRDYKSMILELIVPILLIILGIVLSLIEQGLQDADPYELVVTKYETPQNILYPFSEGPTEELMDSLLSDEITTDSLSVPSIEAFDLKVYELRDFDPYRMGSFYFSTMNFSSNQYEPVIFHNQTAFQSMPTYYQTISRAILQNLQPTLNIVVYNHPLPFTDKFIEKEESRSTTLLAAAFGMAYSFIPGAIIAYIVKEREDSVKHQSMISGVSLWAYWLSNFMWDFAKYLLVAVFSVCLLYVFDIREFVDESDKIFAFIILLLLFGVAMVLFTYSVSFMFQDYSTAQVMTILSLALFGYLLPTINFVFFIVDSTRDFSKFIRWPLRLIPSYCLGNGTIYLLTTQSMSDFEERSSEYDVYSLESTGGDILMLALDILIYGLVLVFLEWIECSPFARKFFLRPAETPPGQYSPDEDVQAEELAAATANPQEVQLVLSKLRKVYGSPFTASTVAVESLSFKVDYGSCFGLLGVNGAGKTSTFQMLTGVHPPSSGLCYLNGCNIERELDRARQSIGYCPQFDALCEFLTCEEHLKLYAEIKGVHETCVAELVEGLLRDLDILEYREYLAGTLSGGNRRKLSVAIALVGEPTVLFLDEPSAGLDPETKTRMVEALVRVKARCAMVLTTDCMEDAEAVCDRIGIMVAGRIRCVGTPKHIKQKFGRGNELEIKIKTPGEEEIEEMMEKMEKVNRVIGEGGQIGVENLRECMEAMVPGDRQGAVRLYDEVSHKGAGSAIYNQMKSEGVVAGKVLASWVLVELRGQEVLSFLRKEFKEVNQIEHYISMFRFRISKESEKTLGFLFNLIENNKDTLMIEDYAAGPMTMDQIFSEFAAQEIRENPEDNELN